jgi:hypothetical protein
MNDTNLVQRLIRRKSTYIILAVIAVWILAVTSCNSGWKAGRSFSSRDGRISYKIDGQAKDLVLVRSEIDPSTQASKTHTFKIMAYHDAWVELDTTGTGLVAAAATAFKDKLVYTGRYGYKNCDPCVVTDTAFVVSVGEKK